MHRTCCLLLGLSALPLMAQTGEDFSRELGRAVTSIAAGNHQVAIAILDDVVKRNPDLGVAWYQLALARRALGRQADAFRAAEHAERLLPASTDARLLLAELCATGDRKRASTIATDLLAKGAEDPALLRRLLPVLITAQDERVKQLFARLLEVEPRNTDLLQQKMQWALEHRDLPTAIEALQQHIALEPKNPLPLQSLAHVQLTAGRTDAALATFERLLQLNPSNLEARQKVIQLLEKREGAQAQVAQHQRLLEFYRKQTRRWEQQGRDDTTPIRAGK